MPSNAIVAEAYAAQYTVKSLRDIRAAALLVHADGGTITRSFEGSSLTISMENVTTILETVAEALRIKCAESDGLDAELSRPSLGALVDFRTLRLT